MRIWHLSYFAVLLGVALVAVTGCGLMQATPEVVEKPVTVVVERTVLVPQTVVVERVITATPEPSPTLTLTPTPAPTIAVEIPDDWVLYQDPADRFTLYRPGSWTIREQYTSGVAFDLPGGGFVILGLVTDPPTRGEIGDQDVVNEMVREIMGDKDGVIILSKGTWALPSNANYVEYKSDDLTGRSRLKYHIVYAEKPVDDEMWWYISMNSVLGGTLSGGDIEALQTMLATIQMTLG